MVKPQYEIARLSYESLSPAAKKQIVEWRKEKKPVSRNDWHFHYILEAYLVSTRSLDAQTQCGCVLVRNKRIIGSGYNSFIGDIKDDVLPNLRPGKYPFMIHSEHNAVLNCAKHGISCDGATAYVTGQPCFNCLQFMYQAGIRNIYYANRNMAVMSNNEEAQVKFEILAHLMPSMSIYALDLTQEAEEKIQKIQSCR